MQTTEDHLLGGRLRYRQPAEGFRTGIEPVLLAAAIAPRPGARVLEAGAGAGAASLCLAGRMAGLGIGITGVAVERDVALAALAAGNLAANGFAGIRVVAADMTQGAALAPGCVDHAFANPPWHRAASTASADSRRDLARRALPGLEAGWAATLAGALRHRGTVTLILPAARLPAWLAALMAAGCGSPRVLPLWPRAGTPAKLVLLRCTRAGAGDCVLLPGLVLHGAGGGFTPQANAVLRDGAPIAL